MKRLALLAVALLGLVAAAEADPAARAILVAAVAMGGCVGAMALIGAWIGGDR